MPTNFFISEILSMRIQYEGVEGFSDANELYKIIINRDVDVRRFVGSLSRAFLPGPVYSLEEYGLPRMISKKIQGSKLVDFTRPDFGLNEAIGQFQDIGLERMLKISSLTSFDKFVLKFFYDGITPGE